MKRIKNLLSLINVHWDLKLSHRVKEIQIIFFKSFAIIYSIQALLDLGHTQKTQKQKPLKWRLLSSTKGEENRIEL